MYVKWYDVGMKQGRHDAARTLNLEYHSEMMRITSEMPDMESLPLDVEGRREWMTGYANGIIRETTGEEVHLVRIWPGCYNGI